MSSNLLLTAYFCHIFLSLRHPEHFQVPFLHRLFIRGDDVQPEDVQPVHDVADNFEVMYACDSVSWHRRGETRREDDVQNCPRRSADGVGVHLRYKAPTNPKEKQPKAKVPKVAKEKQPKAVKSVIKQRPAKKLATRTASSGAAADGARVDTSAEASRSTSAGAAAHEKMVAGCSDDDDLPEDQGEDDGLPHYWAEEFPGEGLTPIQSKKSKRRRADSDQSSNSDSSYDEEGSQNCLHDNDTVGSLSDNGEEDCDQDLSGGKILFL